MDLTCIMCPIGCTLKVSKNGETIEVLNNSCIRGKEYGINEFTKPMRIVTSLARLENGMVVSCKTSNVVPKEMVFETLKAIHKLTIKNDVKIGEVLINNVCGLDVDICATQNGKI